MFSKKCPRCCQWPITYDGLWHSYCFARRFWKRSSYGWHQHVMYCISYWKCLCATIVTKNVSGLVRSDNNSYPDHVFIGHWSTMCTMSRSIYRCIPAELVLLFCTCYLQKKMYNNLHAPVRMGWIIVNLGLQSNTPWLVCWIVIHNMSYLVCILVQCLTPSQTISVKLPNICR